MEKYEKQGILGEGQFGVVFKAKHKETGQVVAIKKIRLGLAKEVLVFRSEACASREQSCKVGLDFDSFRQGVNMTALREVKLLKELHSPHIVSLIDTFAHKNNLALVFEFMESDLEMVIKNRATVLSHADVKAYMQMLLQALGSVHDSWILHRDIKPNNFLIGSSGKMKLADFGLGRIYGSPDRKYTNQVFARWYRPPELLFGSSLYGPAVDIWAAGCCFGELLLRKPWMPGNSDIEQLSLIFQNLGTPTEISWPGAKALPNYVEFQRTPAPALKSIFPKASDDALDLLGSMMTFDPQRRPTAGEALKHRYFKSAPLATDPSRLPKPPVRAHNPLKMLPEGGSALQGAPEGSGQEPLGDDLPTPDTRALKRKLDATFS